MAANFASHPIISVLPDNHRYLERSSRDEPPLRRQRLLVFPKNLKLSEYGFGDAKLCGSTPSLVDEFFHGGLDDASDPLPQVRAAYGEDRDSFDPKGRYSLRKLRGQN